MSTKDYPSVDYIRQCFVYRDGHVFWKERPQEHFLDGNWRRWNTQRAGKEAGTIAAFGCSNRKDKKLRCRIVITVNGKVIFIYRSVIVWALFHGKWPPREVDHKDRCPTNDRIDNLRLATQVQNSWNREKNSNNTSGYKGVSFNKNAKMWQSEIRVNGKKIYLGVFRDLAEAYSVRHEAEKKYFGEFFCETF